MATITRAGVVGSLLVMGTVAHAGLVAQAPPAGQANPASPPQQSSSRTGGQPCVTATDPEYGLTAQKAVQIGGGAMYMAARERRYLDSLKGPGGEALTYKRLGSAGARVNDTQPIDMWEVTWDGAAKPITLYLLAYMYGEPRVPAGFTCSGFTLGNPPIDGFMAREQRTRVAVSQGATQDFAPISLDPDGSAKSGLVFDAFRMIARASRAATSEAKPLDLDNLPPAVTQQGMVIVAYSKTCGGKPASATAIHIGTASGGVQSRQPYVSGGDLSKLLPGVGLPAGSVAAVMPTDALYQNQAVRVMFDDRLCDEKSRTAFFQVSATGARGNVMPEPTLPEGGVTPAEPVWLQAVVDLEGRLLNAQHVGGPGGVYVDRARETLREWKADPARVNGSPVVADTHVVFAFKK